jgi:hypothetical protein
MRMVLKRARHANGQWLAWYLRTACRSTTAERAGGSMRITEEMIGQARLQIAALKADLPVGCITFECAEDEEDKELAELGDRYLAGEVTSKFVGERIASILLNQ